MSTAQKTTAPAENCCICAKKFTASGRSWVWRALAKDTYEQLKAEKNITDLMAQILARRDIHAPAAEDFLHPTLKKLMPDPSHLRDMDKGVARIIHALVQGERIGVIGDYDVDGACSTAILIHYLNALGAVSDFIIPDRITDGYGPQPHLIDALMAKGCSLILTLDCGSTAIEALTHAKNKGVDLIVVDHHSMQMVPDEAYAIINPNRPDQVSALTNLCAAGVVFIMLVALNRALRARDTTNADPLQGKSAPDLRALLDLVALATVCDVMTLRGLNRAFLKHGLEKIQTPRLGIRALMETIGVDAIKSAYNLGFQIGPHINAGGRVGEPTTGVRLLLSTEETEANHLAQQLKTFNTTRKAMEKEAITLAQRLAADQIALNRSFLVIHHASWHPGVIGIVAGRIKDQFNRPVAILCGKGNAVKGSARSIPGIHVGDLMQDLVKENILCAGGGHAMAAGLSLHEDHIETFLNRINDVIHGVPIASPTHMVDLVISPRAAHNDLIAALEIMEPYGNGNPQPTIVISNAIITHIRDIKGEHLGLTLEDSAGGRLEAIAFRTSQSLLGDMIHMNKGKTCHLLGTLGFNRWNGQNRPQLIVSDIGTELL